MNSAFKMIDFVLQMMNFGDSRQRWGCSGCPASGQSVFKHYINDSAIEKS